MGGTRICADCAPSFTVVGADMILGNVIQNSDWSFFYILLRDAYLCRLLTVSHGGRCGYVSSQLYSKFRLVISIFCCESHICADCAPSFTVVGADKFLHNITKMKIIHFRILSRDAYLCRLRTVFHGGRCG